MKAFVSVLLLLIASGCAPLRTGSDVNAGRRAFLIGNHEAALSYFSAAAARDPEYVYGTALPQNIWSYVGRAEYALGRYPQARQALERAIAADQNDEIARLYLGLTLARNGDRQRGLKEIESGMRGIHNWLDYVTQAHRYSYGQYWDPRGEIRSAIRNDLAMIQGRDFDWQKLVANGEWLGKRMEEESDRAQEDESRDMSRESGDGQGDHP